MAFWDFWFKPKTDYWENLYRAEKSRADKLYYDLIGCQTENSRILSAARLAMEGRQSLENQISQLKTTIQVLKEDADKCAELLANQSADLENSLEEIRDLITIREELLARLANAIVLDKTFIGTLSLADRAKSWWEAEKLLWKVYARQSITGYEEWPAVKVGETVNKAVSGLTWHSPAKDGTYRVISVAQTKAIIEESFVPLMAYIAELHDCDDFSQEMRMHFNKYTLNTAIECWGFWGTVYHSRNLILCKEGVLEVEPQTGQSALLPPGIGDNFTPQVIHDW